MADICYATKLSTAEIQEIAAFTADVDLAIPFEDESVYGNGSYLSYSDHEEQFGLPLYSPSKFVVGKCYTDFHGFPLVSFAGDTMGLKLGYSPKRDLHFFTTPDYPEGHSYNHVIRASKSKQPATCQKTFFWLYQIPSIFLMAYDIKRRQPASVSASEGPISAEDIAIPTVGIKKKALDLVALSKSDKPPKYLDSFTVVNATSYLPNVSNQPKYHFNYDKHHVMGNIFEQLIYDKLVGFNSKPRSIEESAAEFKSNPLFHYTFDVTVDQLKSRNLTKIIKQDTIDELVQRGNQLRAQTTAILAEEQAYDATFHRARFAFFAQLEKIRAKILTSFVASKFWESFTIHVIDAGVKRMDNRVQGMLKRKAEACEKSETAKKRILASNSELPTEIDLSEIQGQEGRE